MKKRTVVLVLAMVLCLSLVGCGNSVEPKQEPTNQVTESEQEENTGGDIKNDIAGEDLYWGYIYNEPQETDFEPSWEYFELYSDYVEIPMNKDTNIYDDNGNLLGYLYDRENIDDTINVFAVADDYVRTAIFINDDRVEVNIKHEDLEDSSQVKDLFAEKKQETEETDTDGTYARQVFDRILEQGGMEVDGESLITVAEDRTSSGGVLINIPRENTGEWAREKKQAFLDKGLKYYYMQSYGWTDYTVSVMLWLGTEDKKAISEDEIKAFFQTESDLEIQKKSNIYYDIFEKVGFDEEKTYSIDEYIEVLSKMFEEMGKKSNQELADMDVYSSYDGFYLLRMINTDFSSEATQNTLYTMEIGKDGYGGITEFSITKGQKDGQDCIIIIAKVDLSQQDAD